MNNFGVRSILFILICPPLDRAGSLYVVIDTIRAFPDSSAGQESTCNAGDPGSIPGSERSTGEGTGYPFQYSWASLVAQRIKNPPAIWETWVQPGFDPWRREKLPTPVFLAWRIP